MTDNDLVKNDQNDQYHKATNAFFYASLVQIPIFALPAIVSVFLGKYLDSKFGTDQMIMFSLLFISFVVSWIFVLRINDRITREYKKIREQMKMTKDSQTK